MVLCSAILSHMAMCKRTVREFGSIAHCVSFKVSRALRWRPSFLFLVVVLPAVSTALQMTFTIKYGAYKQLGYDGTLCDVTDPIW